MGRWSHNDWGPAVSEIIGASLWAVIALTLAYMRRH